MTHTVDWHGQLFEQLDWHWQTSARRRLDGLTDEEYRWEPVPGCWNVRPRGTGTAPIRAGRGPFTCDFAEPEPDPAPVTTIAWRLAHLTVGCFGARTASHFGGPAYDEMTYAYPGDAATALGELDTTYAAWRATGSARSTPMRLPVRSDRRRGRSTQARWPRWCSTSIVKRFIIWPRSPCPRDLFAHR